MIHSKKIILFFLIYFFLVSCGKKGSASEESLEPVDFDPDRSIRVGILWEKKKFPFEMELYEGAIQRPVDLWATGSVKNIEDAPVSIRIEGNDLFLKPGAKKKFVLVVKNDSDRDFYFFAAPHSMEPAEGSLGFKFKCLCINHAFYVPAREIWYRVVELRTGGEALSRDLRIKHTLIGMDEERIRIYQKGLSGENAAGDVLE
ncbi:hypothetical protein EHQ12_17940 [Leptospira gomenensis]|uniref:Lipoprotein n=1 Tax=Leptospira gomenensis TaxID=2484974 RepID=A0A5F1YD26_9LEPT|nr:hypothetical protein [Leptospira gomenensis]TGK33217.1 hypothetical protein EHQ12_17940 [Leptospira gomenensis]TGK35550.1 hypothetical protein EHQ17_06385 [Leptospira gomenensis]TGK40873.1 hypothetical protein EHQ07_17345 [Leptospira gomenensis]TGK61164.1 hypothetical protein EHQ13_09880 [Leptospira gomenensis]